MKNEDVKQDNVILQIGSFYDNEDAFQLLVKFMQLYHLWHDQILLKQKRWMMQKVRLWHHFWHLMQDVKDIKAAATAVWWKLVRFYENTDCLRIVTDDGNK